MRLSSILRRATLALLVVSTAAAAEPQWCVGKVQRVLHDAVGAVHVNTSFRNDWLQICNTEVAWKGVAPSICKSWLASAKVAVAAGMNVTIHYAEAPACHLMSSYGEAPVPNYFMLLTPGLDQ